MSHFVSYPNSSPEGSPRAAETGEGRDSSSSSGLGQTSPSSPAETLVPASASKPSFLRRGYNMFFGAGRMPLSTDPDSPTMGSGSSSPQSSSATPTSASATDEKTDFFGSGSRSSCGKGKSSWADHERDRDSVASETSGTESTKLRSSSAHFIPELVGTEKLTFGHTLTQAHAIALYRHLPRHLSMQNMRLAYSLSNDGSDLNSFFAKARGLSNTVLVIQTVDGAEYGCYSASEWKNTPTYYGSGESFIFSVAAGTSAGGDPAAPAGVDSAITIVPYKWTGANTLFQFSSSEQLAMGGGGGGFGLLLENDFDIAESLPCETYGNPCSLDSLNSDGTSSKVCNVELWTFTLDL